MKVLHIFGTAVLARHSAEWWSSEFAKHGIEFHYEPTEYKAIARGGLLANIDKFMDFVAREGYDWISFGDELFSGVDKIWNHTQRKAKIFVFLQEQPQNLFEVERKRPYCDVMVTASPVFQDKTDGYLPVPIHTPYIKERILSWEEKDKSILISGSHRNCRFELFKQLFSTQPFRWPVRFLASGLEHDPRRKEEFESLAKLHPELSEIPQGHSDYIPSLIRNLNRSRIFIDCTFNPYPALKKSQGNASLKEIGSILSTYKGGYAPERVLDACFMGNACFVLKNPAIEYCIGQSAIQYSSYEDLVEKVSTALENEEQIKQSAAMSQSYSQAFTAEKIFEQLAMIFKTVKHTHKYVDRRNNG